MYNNILVSNDFLYDLYEQPVILTSGEKVKIYDVVTVNSMPYYEISNSKYRGYVQAEYIYVGSELPEGVVNPWQPSQPPVQTPSVTPTPDIPDDTDFETKLLLEGFPESYRILLENCINCIPIGYLRHIIPDLIGTP